jgi:hypothetical protein
MPFHVKHRLGDNMPRIHDLSGNSKRRTPMCAVTKAMADAGKAKLDALTAEEQEVGITDDQLVSEIFHAMWVVYWQQVFTLQDKKVRAPHAALMMPQTGLLS